MTFFSMTGFGKAQQTGKQYFVSCEIKSVNHRFLDLRFKMSSLLMSLEIPLRQLIEKELKRGSVDINIYYKITDVSQLTENLDERKIKAYLQKFDQLSCLSPAKQVPFHFTPSDFLKSEFFKEKSDAIDHELQDLIFSCTRQALEKLKGTRQNEGEKLIDVIKGHVFEYKKHFEIIKLSVDKIEQSIKDRLTERFKDFSAENNIDPQRWAQEILYYLEKQDIHEEINRIIAHLQKLDTLLITPSEIGRELDFLLQELNRETNTIGPKSGVVDISMNVVQMKVQLEKIREQALNLE